MPSTRDVLTKAANLWQEKRLGVDTRGVEGAHTDRQFHYATVSYGLIERTLEATGIGPGDVLIDVGCGRGRVLACAARRSVAEVIGLELDSARAAIARSNLDRMRSRVSSARVVVGDASTYEFTNETVIYMFNPFGGEVMAEMMTNLERSIETNPRSVTIAYVYPLYPEPVTASGAFSLVEILPAGYRGGDHDVAIYRTARV